MKSRHSMKKRKSNKAILIMLLIILTLIATAIFTQNNYMKNKTNMQLSPIALNESTEEQTTENKKLVWEQFVVGWKPLKLKSILGDVSVNIDPEPILAQTKSVDKSDAVEVGEELTYTIKVSNSGTGPATDVNIEDTVPFGTNLVAESISDKGKNTDGKITWTIDKIDAGKSKSVSFKAKVINDSIGNIVSNVAKVNDKETNTVENEVKSSLNLFEVDYNLEKQETMILIDTSLSMAAPVNATDGDIMANTYEETRWYALVQSLDRFIDIYMANGKNAVSIYAYNKNVVNLLKDDSGTKKSDKTTNPEKAKSAYKNVFTEDHFNNIVAVAEAYRDPKNTDFKEVIDMYSKYLSYVDSADREKFNLSGEIPNEWDFENKKIYEKDEDGEKYNYKTDPLPNKDKWDKDEKNPDVKEGADGYTFKNLTDTTIDVDLIPYLSAGVFTTEVRYWKEPDPGTGGVGKFNAKKKRTQPVEHGTKLIYKDGTADERKRIYTPSTLGSGTYFATGLAEIEKDIEAYNRKYVTDSDVSQKVNYFIMLTDGESSVKDEVDKENIQASSRKIQEDYSVTMYTIEFSKSLTNLHEKLGDTLNSENEYKAETADELEDLFIEIAGIMNNIGVTSETVGINSGETLDLSKYFAKSVQQVVVYKGTGRDSENVIKKFTVEEFSSYLDDKKQLDVSKLIRDLKDGTIADTESELGDYDDICISFAIINTMSLMH